jgi:hypothetical protein
MEKFQEKINCRIGLEEYKILLKLGSLFSHQNTERLRSKIHLKIFTKNQAFHHIEQNNQVNKIHFFQMDLLVLLQQLAQQEILKLAFHQFWGFSYSL